MNKVNANDGNINNIMEKWVQKITHKNVKKWEKERESLEQGYIITISLYYAVLRCVGIPARPVTNFESAHDANFNRAIDFYFDLNNEVVEEKSGDSIWSAMSCDC